MNTQKLLTWPQIPMNEYKCECGLTSSPFEACPNCEASHLSQSDATTAQPLTKERWKKLFQSFDPALSLDKTESFSAWIDQQGDSLAAPTSFDEWLRQNDDSI